MATTPGPHEWESQECAIDDVAVERVLGALRASSESLVAALAQVPLPPGVSARITPGELLLCAGGVERPVLTWAPVVAAEHPLLSAPVAWLTTQVHEARAHYEDTRRVDAEYGLVRSVAEVAAEVADAHADDGGGPVLWDCHRGTVTLYGWFGLWRVGDEEDDDDLIAEWRSAPITLGARDEEEA